MAASLHQLLLRQLRKANASADAPPDKDAWEALLQSVSRAYVAADEDRYTIERSLELSSQEMKDLYDRLSEERDRLERELEIARVLQTMLLPRSTVVSYLDIAARMMPATEVGGDYYEVIPVRDACWIGIGDVTGHGLRAAIIMMMLQSMIAALVRSSPEGRPSRLLARVNRALWEGLRDRLRVDDHITCTLLRCTPDGGVVYAGAHEDLLISRGGAPCERVRTTGTWLGVTPEIERITFDHAVRLAVGDLLVLYTDGVIEAMNHQREQFGTDRLASIVDAHRDRPVEIIRDAILADVGKWMNPQRDDLTLLVMRYQGFS